MIGPNWYDGVVLEMILPKIFGRACWGTAVRLIRERRSLVRPVDDAARETAAFDWESPDATPLQRRAALAMAECLDAWR